MKKFICLILTVMLSLTSLLVACNKGDKILIYSPDGAPALSLTRAISKEFYSAEINIVSADKIAGFITGETKKADVCVLPINLASKLIGDGEDYKMLGTITHGNFYFLSNEDLSLTKDNLNLLVGKTVGVMQLNNVPGLTLKCVLDDSDLDFITIQDAVEKQQDKVNLMAINKVETSRTDIDLFLIPSPQADIKVQTTNLKFVGSLGELYSAKGFPQAIIVAKTSLIESNLKFIKEFIAEIKGVEDYLFTEDKIKICSLIHGRLESGLTPVFNENNLTNGSIERSKIQFVNCENSTDEVNAFISKLSAMQPNSVQAFSSNFYYLGGL